MNIRDEAEEAAAVIYTCSLTEKEIAGYLECFLYELLDSPGFREIKVSRVMRKNAERRYDRMLRKMNRTKHETDLASGVLYRGQ